MTKTRKTRRKARRLGEEILDGLQELKQAEKKDRERNQRLYRTYGITLDEYNEKLSAQAHVCKICQTLPPSGRLCVDHLHIKGFKQMLPEEKRKYVRGLLCFLCNVGLKGFEKTNDPKINRQRLEGTYQYFQEYKLKGEI